MLIKTKTHKNRGLLTYRDYDWFIEHYINQKMDFLKLASLAGCGFNTIRRWRTKLNVPSQDPHRNYRHRIFSEKHKDNIRKSRIGKFCGSKSSNWKGGITTTNEMLRKSEEYTQWRISVLTRDSFMCRECGSHSNLYAHHILPRRDNPELIFVIDNGITLCKRCHEKTFWKEYLFADKFNYMIITNMAKATV